MDFVNFDIAKKLKEKGFNEPCFGWYYATPTCAFDHKENIVFNHSELRGATYDELLLPANGDNINAPTIEQVLKWLREKHATHIEISLGRNGWYFEIIQYEYYEEEKEYGCKLITISVINDSYEDSALAGIEYSLDNLI